MAWVRIHDGAMTHPKVVGLNDKAFRLWVWGLSYAQQHLTDGLIPAVAIPGRLMRAAVMLSIVGLWDARNEGGFMIHDYLDWNDGKALITRKRQEAKDRMANARVRANFSGSSTLGRVGVESSEGEREREPYAWTCPHPEPKCTARHACGVKTALANGRAS